ncbi:MAG: VacJ family lipoprotein [Alphaproteobacteria bacterium]|nr:VacJ family lipoprotein [Alphaproteobacteria bacterium]
MSSKILTSLAALLLLANLSACATEPTDPAERAEFQKNNDPLEPMNRTVFEFNQIVDRFLLKPAAQAYRYVMPDFARDIVGNVIYNAGEPVRMTNALLQGRATDAGKIFNRFLVNSTAGLGGMIDMGSESDLKPVSADFGQTLHTWGAPQGPYLVLPILGPSNPRDAVGFAVDAVAQPWGYIAYGYGGTATSNRYEIASVGAEGLDKRTKYLDALDALEKGSLDFYAQLRSVSRQHRDAELGIAPTAEDNQYGDGDVPGKTKAKKYRHHKKAAKPAAASAVPSGTLAAPADAPVSKPAKK